MLAPEVLQEAQTKGAFALKMLSHIAFLEKMAKNRIRKYTERLTMAHRL